MSTIGQNRASDRVTVRNFTKVFGNAGLFALFATVLGEKVRGARGRSTLEERPFHIARRSLEQAQRIVLTDEDKAFEVPALTKEALETAKEVLTAHGPAGVLDIFNVIYRSTSAPAGKLLEKAEKQALEAEDHLAKRRELFKPSKTAVAIGLATMPVKAPTT